MRLHQLSSFGIATLALGLAPACSGGQTGDLSGQNDGKGFETSNHRGCDEHKELLASFDDETSAGSANALLAYAETTFDAPISWKQAGAGQYWELEPESGQGVVHISVARGAKAYKLTYSPPQATNGQEIQNVGVICPPPQLGVEAQVTISTDGGALDESFETLLRSDTAGVASLSLPLDLQNLAGALAASSSRPNAKLVQTRLEAVLTARGSTGHVQALEQTQHGSGPDSAVSAGVALLAVWPASEACRDVSPTGEGIAVSLTEEALGFTGSQSIDSITPASAAPIAWRDGSETTLTVGIEPLGDGCFHVRQSPIPQDAGPAVVYPVTITLKSADGRVDASYTGKVTATGAGSSRRVSASAMLTLPAAEVAESGFTSVQVPSGSESVMLTFEANQVGGKAAGSVQLVAISSPPCSTTPVPMSDGSGAAVPPCPGQSRTPLETASWSD